MRALPSSILGLTVLAAAILAAPSPAASAPDGDRGEPAETTILVDAQGRVVGPVVASFGGTFALVRLLSDSLDVSLPVRAARLGGENFVSVGFETTDCTGTPWLVGLLHAAAATFFREAAVGPANLLYVGSGPRVTPAIASQWVLPLDGPAHCEAQTPTAVDALPATPALDLNVFRPPFRIR